MKKMKYRWEFFSLLNYKKEHLWFLTSFYLIATCMFIRNSIALRYLPTHTYFGPDRQPWPNPKCFYDVCRQFIFCWTFWCCTWVSCFKRFSKTPVFLCLTICINNKWETQKDENVHFWTLVLVWTVLFHIRDIWYNEQNIMKYINHLDIDICISPTHVLPCAKYVYMYY